MQGRNPPPSTPPPYLSLKLRLSMSFALTHVSQKGRMPSLSPSPNERVSAKAKTRDDAPANEQICDNWNVKRGASLTNEI